jgi:hypothetical protein
MAKTKIRNFTGKMSHSFIPDSVLKMKYNIKDVSMYVESTTATAGPFKPITFRSDRPSIKFKARSINDDKHVKFFAYPEQKGLDYKAKSSRGGKIYKS